MKHQLLRLNQVIQRVGLSRSTIYAKMQNLEFPMNYKIGYRAVAWLEEDINEWIDGKVTKSRG